MRVKSKTAKQLRKIAEDSIAKFGFDIGSRTENNTFYWHGKIPLFRIFCSTYNNTVNGKFVRDLPYISFSFMNSPLRAELHLCSYDSWFVSHDGRVADFVLKDLETIKKHFENPWVISVYRENNGWASTIGPFKSKEEAMGALSNEAKSACKKQKASIGPTRYRLKSITKNIIAEISNGCESTWFFVGQMITPVGDGK